MNAANANAQTSTHSSELLFGRDAHLQDAQTSTHSSELFAASERFDLTVERAEAALRRSPTRGRSPRPSSSSFGGFGEPHTPSRWPYERFTVELRANSDGQFRIQLMQEDENGLGLVDASVLVDRSDAVGDISISLIGQVDVHDDRGRMLKGDVVRQVNGKDVGNKSLYAVQQMLLSSGGEVVQLTLERPRAGGPGGASGGPTSPSPIPNLAAVAAKMSTLVPELRLSSPDEGIDQPVGVTSSSSRSRDRSRGGSQ